MTFTTLVLYQTFTTGSCFGSLTFSFNVQSGTTNQCYHPDSLYTWLNKDVSVSAPVNWTGVPNTSANECRCIHLHLCEPENQVREGLMMLKFYEMFKRLTWVLSAGHLKIIHYLNCEFCVVPLSSRTSKASWKPLDDSLMPSSPAGFCPHLVIWDGWQRGVGWASGRLLVDESERGQPRAR